MSRPECRPCVFAKRWRRSCNGVAHIWGWGLQSSHMFFHRRCTPVAPLAQASGRGDGSRQRTCGPLYKSVSGSNPATRGKKRDKRVELPLPSRKEITEKRRFESVLVKPLLRTRPLVTRRKVGAAPGRLGSSSKDEFNNKRRSCWHRFSPWGGRGSSIPTSITEDQWLNATCGKPSTGSRHYAVRDASGLGGAGRIFSDPRWERTRSRRKSLPRC